MMHKIQIPYSVAILILFISICGIAGGQENHTPEQYLDQLKKVLPPDYLKAASDQLPGTPPAHVSPEDNSWHDWLHRTGELPPDFDDLPYLPFLPNPLIIDEGGKNIPVQNMIQWNRKREQIKMDAQHWITGTFPPAPQNLRIEVVREELIAELTERDVIINFGPENKAQLHITLLTPPGSGPHPVFICPWKKDRYDWIQSAVRRGYIGCRFTATDPKYGYHDDSEAYEELWWPDYDFSTIMRWAWAASRVIDYLYTLPVVDKNKIALAGLSRNGKMALWAAAYDERIKAVIPISGGTGGENPFRYTSDKYNSETIEVLTRIRPHWLHPRLRFFVGHEHMIPVDANSLMALVAPRGLMITSSIFESAGNPWGIEQAFLSAKKVYEFLEEEDNIAIDLRHGLHAPSATDMERYLDFCDFVFKRGNLRPENKLFYDYSFDKWLKLSEENINPLKFPQRKTSQLLIDHHKTINHITQWEQKVSEIRKQIKWALGEEPPSVGPGEQTNYMRDVVGHPSVQSDIQSRSLLFGQLFMSTEKANQLEKDKKTPVVIYLHEYSYSTGFVKAGDVINKFVEAGYAVYAFDQIGFGSRIEEGRLFYDRFPHWSKMGRMVSDVRWAVDELSKDELIDSNKIFIVGYSLGGTVGLYSTALDDRIAGLVSIAGFTPMQGRTNKNRGEGIYEYSHLHGLLPRLGFFVDEEDRIPYDFHDIMAAIAPRPLMIIAPTWDQYASSDDVHNSLVEVEKVYSLYNQRNSLKIYTPEDYNRFSDEMKEEAIKWLQQINNQ